MTLSLCGSRGHSRTGRSTVLLLLGLLLPRVEPFLKQLQGTRGKYKECTVYYDVIRDIGKLGVVLNTECWWHTICGSGEVSYLTQDYIH